MDEPAPQVALMPSIGRYRVTGRLGRGSSAEVFSAVDPVSGAPLAIKRLHEADPEERMRMGRELAALTLLDLPGVVRVVDHGEQDGRAFVVMERVEGTPFPGHACGPEAIEEVSRGLLEVMGRVHAAGIVHRDLKPANVLVTPAGQAVVLDFGLARGTPLGATATATRLGALLGTPLYLAPEQLNGERVDPRADLYAIGVMIFEALEGRPPHVADTLAELWTQRLFGDAPSLPDTVPAPLRELVRRLLCRDREHRPSTAGEALLVLGSQDGVHTLPWLGSTQPLETARQAVRAGRACVISGPRGSGRSRVLAEIGRWARQGGLPVLRTAPATGPFESLPLHLRPGSEVRQDPQQVVAAALQLVLDAGGVLLVDDVQHLDVWTRRLLAEVRGAILSTTLDGGEVQLAPLTQADLLPLFSGPERVYHLRSDAAHELHRRTMGLPRRITVELEAWLRAGLARWGRAAPERVGHASPETPVVHLTRVALDRLAAGWMAGILPIHSQAPLEPELEVHLQWTVWLGADADVSTMATVTGTPGWRVRLERQELLHRGLIEETGLGVRVLTDAPGLAGWSASQRRERHRSAARALAPGARTRLEHLVRGRMLDEVLPEALSRAREASELGRGAQAVGLVARVIRAVPEAPALTGIDQALSVCVQHAVSVGTPGLADEVLALLARCGRSESNGAALVRATRLSRTGRRAAALSRLQTMEAFEDPAMELCRRAEMVRAVRFSTHEAEDALLAEMGRWSLAQPATVRGRYLTWEGSRLGRRGDHQGAARLHEESLTLRGERLGRIASKLNAAEEWVWVPELDRALRHATEARTQAADIRHVAYEAEAERLLRVIAHRRGDMVPDLELAAARWDDPGIVLNEAIVATRGGHPLATRLARRAEELTIGAPRHWVRAMRVVCGDLAADEVCIEEIGDLNMRMDAEALVSGRKPEAPRVFSGVWT